MKHSRIYVAVLAARSLAAGADARITKVTIDSRATAFGGYAWPGVGQYEKITGWAYGELDPERRAQRASSPTSSSRRATPTARSSTRTISTS